MGARVTEAELAVGHAHEKVDETATSSTTTSADGLREALETLARGGRRRARRGLASPRRRRRRLVLGEPPLHGRAREHADEPAVLDDRARARSRSPRGTRKHRRAASPTSIVAFGALGDLAERRRLRVAAARDHFAHERLARDDTDERPSSQTNTARTSARDSASPASCALADASSASGSGTIASRTSSVIRSRVDARALRARRRLRGSRRRAPRRAA